MPDFSKALGLDGRPNKTRSSAGVLGPLIATTAGVASPAVPKSSTIVPDVKRPGYHLSRYSLDDSKPAARFRPHKHSKSDTLGASGLGGAPLTAPATAEAVDSYFALPNDRDDTHSVDTGAPSYKARWSGMIKELPTPGFFTPSGARTPGTDASEESETEWTGEKRSEKREADARRRRRKHKESIFITRHITDLLARQTFICKLARAMMMFGGPSHRLQAQIMSTGRVLEVPLSCMHLPDTLLISFDDQATCTSNIQLIKQGSALDLAKLTFAYKTYWAVRYSALRSLHILMALVCAHRSSTTRSPSRTPRRSLTSSCAPSRHTRPHYSSSSVAWRPQPSAPCLSLVHSWTALSASSSAASSSSSKQ
jgi:hypothetical protein